MFTATTSESGQRLDARGDLLANRARHVGDSKAVLDHEMEVDRDAMPADPDRDRRTDVAACRRA
jgi:hypothetical protein